MKQARNVDTSSGEVTPGVIRPFADVLHDLHRGQIADEAAAQLADLVQAVQGYGKAGTFTLHIKVEPFKGNDHQVMMSARCTSKPPAGNPVGAVFFTDDNGNLSRDDPRQESLFGPREVAQPDARIGDAK